MDGILYYKGSVVCAGNHTGITALAAHGSVEWGFLHDDGSALAVGQGLYNLGIGGQNRNLRLMLQSVITNELRGNLSRDRLVYGYICTHVVGCLTSFSCFLTLLFHGCLEAFLIYSQVLLFQDLDG